MLLHFLSLSVFGTGKKCSVKLFSSDVMVAPVGIYQLSQLSPPRLLIKITGFVP